VSEVGTKPRSFFDLFIDGLVPAKDANDFVTAWHDSGDEEQRPLAEFLGMTGEEYALWMMDRRVLPEIAAARRPGGPALATLMTERVRRMRAANNPIDRTALFSLAHWLRATGIDPA
jgi:hypothetical protein